MRPPQTKNLINGYVIITLKDISGNKRVLNSPGGGTPYNDIYRETLQVSGMSKGREFTN